MFSVAFVTSVVFFKGMIRTALREMVSDEA